MEKKNKTLIAAAQFLFFYNRKKKKRFNYFSFMRKFFEFLSGNNVLQYFPKICKNYIYICESFLITFLYHSLNQT